MKMNLIGSDASAKKDARRIWLKQAEAELK